MSVLGPQYTDPYPLQVYTDLIYSSGQVEVGKIHHQVVLKILWKIYSKEDNRKSSPQHIYTLRKQIRVSTSGEGEVKKIQCEPEKFILYFCH